MLSRMLYALPLAALGLLATTGIASADFNPSRDELAIGTFLFALGVMFLMLCIYAVVWYFGLNRPGEVEIPDHAHDHRYADHH